MKYYKNTEIAALFHVSEKAVRNWVEATQQGKLNLELFEKDGRFLIANTAKNMQIMEDLVSERKKFKNTRSHRVVSPKPEFYNLYNEKQILDIMANIDTHHEIPLQYSYFNGGAVYWREYIQKLLQEKKPNMLTSMISLLEINQGYLDSIIGENKANIIDLCIGEGTPAKKLLEHLVQKDKLAKYVGIDFSKDMLAIANDNVEKWFGDKINYESYMRDLNYDRFEDILRADAFNDVGAPTNILLLLGGTLTNFKDHNLALQMINASLGKDDYLVYGLKLDTEASRRYFDFHIENSDRPLAPNHELVLNLLNIEPTMYDVEQIFDPEYKARFIKIKLKIDTTIKFEVGNQAKSISIAKNDSILVWRYWHQSALDVINQFDAHGFDLMHASLTDNKEYLLTVSKVKI